jgi:hypothetical protein
MVQIKRAVGIAAAVFTMSSALIGGASVAQAATAGKPKLSIVAVAPSNGSTRGHTPLTITGSGFSGVKKVTFGSTDARDFNVVNSTTIEVWTPEHAAGIARITVHTAHGETPRSGASFRFIQVKQPGAWQAKATPMLDGKPWVDHDAQDDADSSRFVTACASASLCYQTGEFARESGGDFVSILVTHDDASTSSQQTPTSPAGLDAQLYAISCATSTWCLGVGSQSPGGTSEALVENLQDGTATPSAIAPESGYNQFWLSGVACAAEDECAAYGGEVSTGSPSSIVSIVAIDQGGSWQVTHVPFIPSAIDCSVPTSCVAVGDKHIATWNGDTWTTSILPKPSGSTSSWSANLIACPAIGECTVTGDANHASGAGDLHIAVWTWHAGSWSVQQLPLADQEPNRPGYPLAGLSCPAAQQCFAAGDWSEGLLVHEDGSTLTEQGAPIPAGFGKKIPATDLLSISCPSVMSCDAVGTVGVYGLAETWRGGVWTSTLVRKRPLATGVAPLELDSVQCVSAERCLTSGLLYTGFAEEEGWSNVQEVYAVLPS